MGQSTPESIAASAPPHAQAAEPTLERVLEHPAIWRGRSTARVATLVTGWSNLDKSLPGGGWPAAGLTEILTTRCGLGEMRLLVPLLVHLGREPSLRWVSWISPPFEPYAPALVAAGVPVERQLVVRTAEPAWAIEQALDSGGCNLVLGWVSRVDTTALRRLQLATQRNQVPAILFRPLAGAEQASPAQLRIAFEPLFGGARLRIIKSRGGDRRPIEVHWSDRIADPELGNGAA